MIEMAVRYADLEKPPDTLPSGWVALLYLFNCDEYSKDLIRNQTVSTRAERSVRRLKHQRSEPQRRAPPTKSSTHEKARAEARAISLNTKIGGRGFEAV